MKNMRFGRIGICFFAGGLYLLYLGGDMLISDKLSVFIIDTELLSRKLFYILLHPGGQKLLLSLLTDYIYKLASQNFL
jgi:hypothetical protein